MPAPADPKIIPAAIVAVKSSLPAPALAVAVDGSCLVLSYSDDAQYSARSSLDMSAIRGVKGVKVLSAFATHLANGGHVVSILV
ncbi:hypothetical protein D4Q85_01125 [bacterium]|nr:MAG: hypothetical protein D4Q85_01125 [bacterium]